MNTKDIPHKLLSDAVKGCAPRSYSMAAELNERGLGQLDGFPNEKWGWDNAKLDKLSKDQLFATWQSMQ